MYIPKENIREKFSIRFIRKMTEIGQSYCLDDGVCSIARIAYKGEWVNIIDMLPYKKGAFGIMPELSKVLEGVVIADNWTAKALMKVDREKWRFTQYNNKWYTEFTSKPVRNVSSIQGENLPSFMLREYINPWCSVKTNNVDFSVTDYRFSPQNDGGLICTKIAWLYQKWDDAWDAQDIISQVESMIKLHDRPIVVLSKDKDVYLEKLGWKVVGQNWSGKSFYMPASVANNANR